MRRQFLTATASLSVPAITDAQPFGAHIGAEASNRISFYIYNTIEEVEYFLETLPLVRRQMGYKGLEEADDMEAMNELYSDINFMNITSARKTSAC